MNKPINNKSMNLGIQLLRMILCFWVLSYHCLKINKIQHNLFYFFKKNFFHVPCFCFISFYFSYNIFLKRDTIKIKRRLERLLIPYLIWPLLFFIIYNFLNKTKLSFHDLILQILLGYQFMGQFWYLFSVTILTIFFYIISNLFKKQFLFILQLIFIYSYFLQYSYSYSFLNQYFDNIKAPLINNLGNIPLSIFGITFASSKILDNIIAKKNIFFLFFLFFCLLNKYLIFIELKGYHGIKHIFVSLSLFLFFYFLPLENIFPILKKIIKQITNYTNGIYCVHMKIDSLMIRNLTLKGTEFYCVIIYLFSYFISFLGIKLFGKNKLKYLFS